MIKDPVYEALHYALQQQNHILDKCSKELIGAPEGFLYVRDTGKRYTCYQVIKKGSKVEQRKISNQQDLVQALLNKAKNKKLCQLCRNNIKVLSRALKNYMPVTFSSLLPLKKHHLMLQQRINTLHTDYPKAPIEPDRHIHETMSGDLVRSKSEVIIANALWHFGIPFNYEEMFPFPDSEGRRIYPDFTIHCPDGTVIIWEHWGMLRKEDYCLRNASKLHTCNEHNYVIGRNLIITQDDSNGNCSTALIYHIIENYILPHFR